MNYFWVRIFDYKREDELKEYTTEEDWENRKGTLLDEYYLCETRDYIDNIEEYLQALSELKHKAEEAQKNLESLCSEYNALAVDGVAYLDYRKTIY